MRICEPNGWKQLTCDYCGTDTSPEGVAVMIYYATKEKDNPYPFLQITLCHKHFDEIGIKNIFKYLKEQNEKPLLQP